MGKTKNLYLELSKTCNLNCSYCYVPQYNKNQKKNSKEEVLAVCDELLQKTYDAGFDLGRVVLHGAETFVLEPEVINAVVHKLHAGGVKKIGVQTNGTLLSADYHDKMGDLSDKMSTIGFSVDARSVHNKYRGNSYDLVLKNLKETRHRGYGVKVLSVITKETLEHLDELTELLKELDSLDIDAELKMVHSKDEYMLTEQDQRTLANWGVLTGQWIKFQSFNPNYCIHGKCHSDVISEFGINGDVHVCNKTNNEQGVIADWKSESLCDVFVKRDLAFSESKLGENCKNCRFWSVCFGGCPNDRDAEGYANDCFLKHYTYFALELKGICFLEAFHRNEIYKSVGE